MGDILSLSRTRKARSKAEAERQAAENRVRFGRSKSEKAADVHAAEIRDRRLDGLKRDGGTDTEDPS